MDALIERNNHNTFHCVDTFPADISFDLFIVTVGTPLYADEKKPNFTYVMSALQSIKGVYTGRELVILRSTVSVGTTRGIVLPYLAELCGLPQEEIPVSMCPERTVEGKAIEELANLPQIISGNSNTALEMAQQFFRRITPFVIPVSSLEEAELVKLYCNTYRDMTFAIGNAFCMAAQSFGVDGVSVIRHANQGYDRANIALPGFVAGPCLEKDAYILTHCMPDCCEKNLIMACRKLNESLEDIVVQWIQRRIGAPLSEKVVVVSGMAFKGQPETSDLRGSASVYIAQKLKRLGYRLYLHDFAAYKKELEALDLGDVFSDLYAACKDASALLVLNNHKKYMEIAEYAEFCNRKLAILDVWGACRNLYLRSSGGIATLGNLMMEQGGTLH